MRFKKKVAFQPERLQEEMDKDNRKVFTISLNLEEYKALQEDMLVLRQPKDSTAIKQLWKVGRNVLHDQKTGLALQTILGNVERNAKSGITVYESKIDPNVTQKNDEK